MANQTRPAAGPSQKSRRTVVQEEDATKLQFGDFADGEALTLTDVQGVLAHSRSAPGVPPAPDNKVYKLTVEYINEFSNSTSDLMSSMRSVFATESRIGFLNKFEIAQILYLRPEKVDVAIALIPSLERYSQGEEEERLQEILDEIRTVARFGQGA